MNLGGCNVTSVAAQSDRSVPRSSDGSSRHRLGERERRSLDGWPATPEPVVGVKFLGLNGECRVLHQ